MIPDVARLGEPHENVTRSSNRDHALAFGVLVQGVTAYILLDEAKVKEGDAVLVSAAGGGLGNLAVQLAKARCAKVVGLTSKSKFEGVWLRHTRFP
jgi:NADPH-dependent curcumin reductase CurA